MITSNYPPFPSSQEGRISGGKQEQFQLQIMLQGSDCSVAQTRSREALPLLIQNWNKVLLACATLLESLKRPKY